MSVRTSGQAAIEAVVVVPLCIVFALLLVDAGLVGADQIAVERAATAAGTAAIAGHDPQAATRSALPKALRRDLHVRHHGARIEISVRARGVVLGHLAPVRLHAVAVINEGAAS